MTAPRFGPAGNAESFYAAGYRHTYEAFGWLAAMGLDAFEYPMGRGVALSQEAALRIGEEARANGVALSAHAPYYINLANPAPQAREKSLRYILDTALRLAWMGGTRMVVHVGAVQKAERRTALQHSLAGLRDALHMLEDNGLCARICVETMGKPAQIGDLEETLAFCEQEERLIPCLDFAHLHALGQGCLNATEDLARVLDRSEQVLGRERAGNMHIHFSTVEYGDKGEKRHRTFADAGFGPRFELLAPLLVERGYAPTVICESRGTMAEDALAMRNTYRALVQGAAV